MISHRRLPDEAQQISASCAEAAESLLSLDPSFDRLIVFGDFLILCVERDRERERERER